MLTVSVHALSFSRCTYVSVRSAVARSRLRPRPLVEGRAFSYRDADGVCSMREFSYSPPLLTRSMWRAAAFVPAA